MIENRYQVAFYENGVPTKTLVKYRGRVFTARVEGSGITGTSVYIYDDKGFAKRIEGVKDGDGYVLTFPELDSGFYRFRVELSAADGNRTEKPRRMLVVGNIYKTVKPPRGVIYQIFPDRFAKSGSIAAKSGEVKIREDAVINGDWYGELTQYPLLPGDNVENNEFFGGTLYGVIEKLNYLKSLGVEWIYLNPVFIAYSNHKYDTGDYMEVDAMLGGRRALDELVAECHKRGMKLILDGVFNHVGRNSIYFDYYGKYGGAYNNAASPYREWFDIRADGSYDCWWGLTNLPKVKKVASFRKFICGTVIPEYMRAGVDGWRLDVVDEYDNAFLEEITAAAKRINPEAVIIGEVWDDVTDKVAYSERKSYFFGAALDSATNYPLRNAIIRYITSGDAEFLKDELENQLTHYPAEKLICMMNILGTHDTERILTVLGGGTSENKTGDELACLRLSPEQREKGKRLLKAAYTLLDCLPGIPTIYYGDEAGLEGHRDPFNRLPFPWGREDREILDHYKEINALRAESMALIKGSTEILQWNDGFFAFEREYKSVSEHERVFCVCNMSESYIYYVNGSYTPLNLKNNEVHPGETGIYKIF